MELTALRSISTALSFLVFVGIVFWAWNGRHKQDFDEAAQLPFADDGHADTPDK